jgi:hypothetical protein
LLPASYVHVVFTLPRELIRSDAAGGKHAVEMGMMLQSLVPSMEHAEEAVPAPGASAGARCPDTWGSAGFGTSCKR